MSERQRQTLAVLAGAEILTSQEIARRLDSQPGPTLRVLDALYRRSLIAITDDGAYHITGRGLRRLTR
jgi:uncharacterized protein YjhX (UPF0386 family)